MCQRTRARLEKSSDGYGANGTLAKVETNAIDHFEDKMSIKYTDDIVEYAYYGIDEHVPEDRTVVVNLRDLMKLHATISELRQFFHQPLHMQTLEEVEKYLGSRNSKGAYNLIHSAQYDVLRRMLPDDVDDLFTEGAFDAPVSPYYFEEKAKDDD